MGQFLARRLLESIPTLIIASMLVFMIIAFSPGDPVAMSLGPEATPEQIERERTRLGLDEPIYVRYGVWVGDVVRLQLGYSLTNGRPVVGLIMNAFPRTFQLAVISLVVSVTLGTALGILSALHRNQIIDNIITAFSSLSLAIPGFWLGIVLILIFSVALRWLPASGSSGLDDHWFLNFRYMILPVISISVAQTAVFTRYMRSTMLDALSADYVRTARAKGLVERIVVSKHALRNALIPVVTIIGIQFARLMAGVVIIEALFSYSGLGRLIIISIMNRDYPVIQASLMLVVVLFLITNLVVDLSYGFLDPRIRLTEAK